MSLPEPASDRTCLVTGASSGIGAEIARCLASRGHGVALVARREPVLAELAAELHEKHGVHVEVLAADLTDSGARRSLPGRLAERGLTVDVLVNNAGFSTSGRITGADEEREVAMVRLDVEAVVSLCALFVPPMAERRRGALLNVASTAAYQPLPGQAGYAAAKAFVLSYTHALRGEVGPLGLSVTVLCPGPVDTEFLDVARTRDDGRDALPRMMWLPAPAVAKAGVDGLAAGHAVVIPGLPNHATAIIAHHTPRSILVPIVAKLSPLARR